MEFKIIQFVARLVVIAISVLMMGGILSIWVERWFLISLVIHAVMYGIGLFVSWLFVRGEAR